MATRLVVVFMQGRGAQAGTARSYASWLHPHRLGAVQLGPQQQQVLQRGERAVHVLARAQLGHAAVDVVLQVALQRQQERIIV